MRQRKVAAIIITVLVLAITAISQRSSRNAGSSQISESALRAHIKFLSDDRLEGRGTGARGGELAALYAAEQFEAMGLKGAGKNGSFWQPVSLVGVKADPKTELRINGASASEAYKFADDFVAFTGAQTEHVSVNAELVFVGYGIDAPEQRWNDYKGPAEDYRGKILVMLVNDPPATREEPKPFRRPHAHVQRAMDLQIRGSRPPRCRRRDPFAYERVGRVSVECGADLEWFVALRHCARRRRSHAVSESPIVDDR